jgi:hypothetical protein
MVKGKGNSIESECLNDDFFNDDLYLKLKNKALEEQNFHLNIGNSIPLFVADNQISYLNPDGSITKGKKA